ncbi:MAG: spore coat protein CotJB [Anaerovoracaceae bacterium]|nr:spore coat protein CotJB [Anaerovoracaceae bacterium]
MMNERQSKGCLRCGNEGRAEALLRVQELGFSITDLALFLNTHPDCREALELYEKLQRKYAEVRKRYEERYGPLTYDGVNTEEDKWSWINEPWPWEGEY